MKVDGQSFALSMRSIDPDHWRIDKGKESSECRRDSWAFENRS